ncbi:MAG: hypothetical protein ACOY71_09915 [Gemmatimonadota bacterium]
MLMLASLAAAAPRAAPFAHGVVLAVADTIDPGLESLKAEAARNAPRIVIPPPDLLARVTRSAFNVPGWVMVLGAVAGLVVAIVLLRYLWRRRQAIRAWIATRSRAGKIALAGAFGVLLVAAAWAGHFGWEYSMYSRDFCYGCHYRQPDVKLTSSDSTPYPYPYHPIAHDTLYCHNCHVQTIPALINELRLWVFARPTRVPPDHGKVENFRCEKCHMESPTEKEKWKRIVTTAGHRAHLESDSLKKQFSREGGTQCVTCHGQQVHRFPPVDSTCYQKGCHLSDSVGIAIGPMKGQTELHCIVCHQFTADVPLLASRDSATGVLRPGSRQCFTCHAMRRRLVEFDVAMDPHKGTCGMCHNPHQQKQVSEVRQTCASAGCHTDWRKVRFHVGAAHRKVSEQCVLCHQPHAARVDASDCAGCHDQARRMKGTRLRPPAPFDTLKALRSSVRPTGSAPHLDRWPRVQAHAPAEEPTPRGKGDIDIRDAPGEPPVPAAVVPPPADSFSHSQHKSLTCLTCHTVTSGKGSLVFERPRGCQICHHQNRARSDCAQCHRAEDYGATRQVRMSVQMPKREPRQRAVPFDHGKHARANVKCVDCHTTPVTMEPAGEPAECRTCHDQHHSAERSCATCHAGTAEAEGAHERTAHVACDACHTPARIRQLTPNRQFCLTCHASQDVDHYAPESCTVCHLQATPEEWQTHLMKRRPT